MRLAAIRLHPVKACRGFEVPRAVVERRGLRDDRRWMLVDPGGRFVTQREQPALALVRASLDGAEIVLTHARGAIAPLRLPRRLAATDARPTRRVPISVWRHEGEALAFEAGRAWFAAAVGLELLPVFLPEEIVRPVSPSHGLAGDEVSFADGFPLLLANAASMDALNERLGARGVPAMTMERFRPNVVIEGAPPFAEDGIGAVRIGAVRFRAPKGCDRCSVTTVDPETGVAGKEPLATLATFRQRDGAVWFGVNLIPELPDGPCEIAVGDTVELEADSGSA
jgi:hypothetical protein